MKNEINFTRENIAEALHSEFGLTKKDCVIFVNDILVNYSLKYCEY